MRRMRIGVHCGSVEHCFFVSKRAGLIIWPAMGAVLGFQGGALVLAGRGPGVAAAGGAGTRPERETTARSD